MGSRTDLGEEFPQNHNLLKTLFSTHYSRNNQILIVVVERWSRVEFPGSDRFGQLRVSRFGVNIKMSMHVCLSVY